MPPDIKAFLQGRHTVWNALDPPPYLATIRDIVIRHKDIWRDPRKPPSVKQIYNTLRTPKLPNTMDADSQHGIHKWIQLHRMPQISNDIRTFWKNFWSAGFAGYSPNSIQCSVYKLRHFIHFVSTDTNRRGNDPWRHLHERLNPPVYPDCTTCGEPLTNMMHVFFLCNRLLPVWARYSPYLHRIINDGRTYSYFDLGLMLFTGHYSKLNPRLRLAITVISYIIHGIWKLRCENHHDNANHDTRDFIRHIDT